MPDNATYFMENDNTIGKEALLHVVAFVSHDLKTGDFCEIFPPAKLLGHVVIRDQCSIGPGAIILPHVRTGNNVTVGAGVTKDNNDGLTVIARS